MNHELIILKEIDNDGSLIYLYKNKEVTTLSAFGKSAYALRLNSQEHKLDNIKLFSFNLDLFLF